MSKKHKPKKLTKAESDRLALHHARRVKECISDLNGYGYGSPALWHLERLMGDFIASKRKKAK